MSCRFVVPMILLAAATSLPAVSQACCDCDSLNHKTRLVIPPYTTRLYLQQRDVPYGSGPTSSGSKAAVVGLGLEFTGPIAHRWSWVADGSYGMGDLKSTTTNSGGTSNTFETQLSQYSARVGLNYQQGRGGNGLYCGPGFEMVSTKATIKNTGFADVKPNPFYVYGFEAHLGGYIPVNRELRLYGETSELIGRGSFKDTFGTLKTETKGYFTSNTWRGGLVYKF